jgi:alanine-glyoxylate transaminase/serine-glyoxylate transaminase/serine-pyruvate transaminase
MRIRSALEALGLKLLISDEQCAHGLTSISTEEKFDSAELVTYMKQHFNIQIAGSLGAYKNRIFRIGHFSDPQMELRNLISTIVGIGTFLQTKGLSCDIEQAIAVLCAH